MHPYLPAAAPSQYPYSMLSGHDQLAAAWQHQAASMYHAGLRASSPYGLPITSAGLPRYVYFRLSLDLFQKYKTSKFLSQFVTTVYFLVHCQGFRRPVYLVTRVFHMHKPLRRRPLAIIIYLKSSKN